jgi:hypothetical protein
MRPEQRNEYLSVWCLIKLQANNIPRGGAGNPYSLVFEDTHYTLESAQHAQTFEALKSGIKYEIFHLEFPL